MHNLMSQSHMSATYQIAEALTATDWFQATTLLQQVYVGGSFTTQEAASAQMTQEKLEPAGDLLIAKQEGSDTVLGAILFLHVNSHMQQLAKNGEREFRLLAVSSEARGKGVGELLVQACIDRAKAESAIGLVLWTQPTMVPAQRLYERLGFLRAKERDTPDLRGFTRLVYVLEMK